MLNYATIKPLERFKMKSSNEDSYKVLKKELDDALFDVRAIEDLDCWFDDELLLKEQHPIPTFVIKNDKKPMITDYDIVICGNVVFTSRDEEGNTVSLTPRAIEQMKSFKMAFLGNHLVHIYETFNQGGTSL